MFTMMPYSFTAGEMRRSCEAQAQSSPGVPKVVQVDPQGSTNDVTGVYAGVAKK